jgi:hypothetical protein
VGVEEQELVSAMLRGLLLLAGVLAGVVIGRMSGSEPAAAEGPVVAVQQALPVPTPAPACPPASAAEAEETPAARAQAERAAAQAQAEALQAAQAALAQEREPERRSELIREIAAHKAQDDLGLAWTWLAQHRTDPGHAENVRNLLYHWSYARPEHVAALLPQVTSGEAQTAAAHQLAQLWNRKDPHAYHAWVASLPDGPLKAAARTPY